MQLSTFSYYRNGEGLNEAQADNSEGYLCLDASGYVEKHGPAPRGSVNATMSFANESDPWIYCASLDPVDNRERLSLCKEISDRYDTGIKVSDVGAFAAQPGIGLARKVLTGNHIQISLQGIVATKAGLNRLEVPVKNGFKSKKLRETIQVYHGLVTYNQFDSCGEFNNYGDIEERGLEAEFSKPVRYSRQNEYRFVFAPTLCTSKSKNILVIIYLTKQT